MRAILIAMALMGSTACSTVVPGFAPTGATYRIDQDEVTIRAILLAQEAAWNRGDIDGFMDGSWRSEKLRYTSGAETTFGFEATTARYKARYSDRSKMGRLEFSDLEVEQISSDAAVVYGAWRLYRETDEPFGLFTLIFRKIDGEWVMVSDTTTSGG